MTAWTAELSGEPELLLCPDQATFAVPDKAQKKTNVAAALKLLPKLLESYAWNQPDRGLQVAQTIASAIEVTHPDVAKGMRRFTEREKRTISMHAVHKPEKLISFEEARHGFENVVLSPDVLAACRAIVEEHAMTAKLAAFDLKPRHRILLHGAPGNGKTLLAEAFAKELGVPFLRLTYGGLIDSHLGQTSKNIDTLFSYASTAPCVVFADEFDGIGMARGDNKDVGEARRITNQLLIDLERLPSHTVFIAATNAEDLMDKALLRRFDFVVEIPKPTPDLVARCATKALDPSITPGFNLVHLVSRIQAMRLPSLYAVVELCKRLRRDLVLNGGEGIEDVMVSAPLSLID